MRVVIVPTQQNLLLLKRSPSWYVDATFKVAPQLFYQVLVIQAELPNHQGGAPWVFPCVYILLTHKTQDIYLEAFIFLNSLLDFSPQVIMSDFVIFKFLLSNHTHFNSTCLQQNENNNIA